MRRRGYDVFAFALAGAAVSVGLDIIPTAIAAAKAEQQRVIPDNPTAAAAVRLVTGDFFMHSSSEDYAGPYDIGYDHTFLCALHPGASVFGGGVTKAAREASGGGGVFEGMVWCHKHAH